MPDDIIVINIHELGVYFNRASSKSIACHYLIGLNERGNTRKVFQGQQTNKFCMFDNFISTIEHFFHQINYSPACIHSKCPPLADQLTSDFMNINEREVVMLPDYCEMDNS